MKRINSLRTSAGGKVHTGWASLCAACVVLLVVLSLPGCAANRGVEAIADGGESSMSNADRVSVSRRALFEQGIDYSTFLASVSRRRAMWLRNSGQGTVPRGYLTRLEKVRGRTPGQLHILAVAEDGCSDSANIVPYLARFVDKVDGLDMRIVDSRVGRRVMESHQTPDGRAATPTIVVLDSDYRELGCLIERPNELQTWALKNKSELPGSEFMTQKFAWYDADLGKQSMAEIVEIIEGSLGNGLLLVNCGTTKQP